LAHGWGRTEDRCGPVCPIAARIVQQFLKGSRSRDDVAVNRGSVEFFVGFDHGHGGTSELVGCTTSLDVNLPVVGALFAFVLAERRKIIFRTMMLAGLRCVVCPTNII
jgi:hypothetical protein